MVKGGTQEEEIFRIDLGILSVLGGRPNVLGSILDSAERQLGNESFLAKAPSPVVEGLKKQEAETRLLLEKARAALASLSQEP